MIRALRPSPRRLLQALLLASVGIVAACGSAVPKRQHHPGLPVRVVDFPAETVLSLSHRGPPAEMLPVLRRLVGYMRARGIEPLGDFMVLFHADPLNTPKSETNYEVAVPVVEGTKAESPYEVKTIPPRTTAAVEIVHCPFEELNPQYEKLYRWTRSHGYVPNGQVTDVFLVKPGPDVAREKLRTEVHLPVAPAD